MVEPQSRDGWRQFSAGAWEPNLTGPVESTRCRRKGPIPHPFTAYNLDSPWVIPCTIPPHASLRSSGRLKIHARDDTEPTQTGITAPASDHLHHLRTAPDGRSRAIFLLGMLGPDSPTWWIRLLSMPAPIGLPGSVDP